MSRLDEDFVHLHVHSHYSLLDGAATVDRLVKAAKDLGQHSLAITDHGNMFGALEFYKKAKKAGLRPIIGSELYTCNGDMREKSDERYHLVVLARNAKGYHNLIKLVTAGYIRGFYRKPRVDMETLRMFSAGLIGMSACLQGETQQLLLGGKFEAACAKAREFAEIFGPEHFYLELQDHGLDEQKMVNPLIVKMAQETGLPLVATNDSHYVLKREAEAQEALLCIQTGKTLSDENRMRFGSNEFYLKSGEEMRELFPEIPEAFTNTVKIANMCQLELELGTFHLPKFEVPGGKSDDEYLEDLCREAIPRRYGKANDEVEKRLEFELATIKKMGFSSYFLIVWDFIDYARKNGISVGPGRGSAAGSIVAYLLGITNLDPLPYDLLFERFLNPERVSMPDIDIDFCFERRGEVIEYTRKKYGYDNVCQIITFGTLSTKAVIKDVGRVLGIPFAEANVITSAVPDELGISLEKALADSKELRQWAERYPKLFEIGATLEGVARNSSTHAAGVVIAPDRLDEFVPLVKRDEDVATQYTMKMLDDIGLLKMDFLGLKTLTVIRNTLRHIRSNQGIELDIDAIPLDDKRSYLLLCKGETLGVFQFESTGFRDLIKRLHPDRFEDLVAVIALYRPGPLGSGMVDDFIEAKHGRKPIEYPHNNLKGILETTYGVMLYQEQVMQTASILAGYSLGQADQLRRAMGKKKLEEMEKHREIFKKGAKEKGISEKDADRVFSLMEKFASYGFNKSHSAAYALVSYQTCFLKANFPAEFMAATLTNEMSDSDKVAVLIEECRRMKLDVLPPDVNLSGEEFSVHDRVIRFGLKAIRGLGANAAGAILEARERHGEFQNLEDFCKSVDLRTVNKRAIEALIKSGAFTDFGQNRAEMLSVVDQAIQYGQETQKNIASGQSTLFDFGSSMGLEIEQSALTYPEIPEFADREILNFEKETLGVYLSGHPLFEHRELLRSIDVRAVSDLATVQDGESFLVAGLIKIVRKRTIKSKNREMAFITLEGLEGSEEFPIFPDLFEEKRPLLQEDNVVLLSGNARMRDGQKRFGVDDLILLDKLFTDRDWKATVRLTIAESHLARHGIARLKNVVVTHKGKHPLRIELQLENRRVLVACGKGFKVNPDRQFIATVEELFGEESVHIQLHPPPRERRNGNGFSGPSNNVIPLKGSSP